MTNCRVPEVNCSIKYFVLAATYSVTDNFPLKISATPAHSPALAPPVRRGPCPVSPSRLPSAQVGLTAVFGMRTGEKRIRGASQGRTERRRRRRGEKFSQQRKTFGDPCDKPSKILFWRLATLAVRLPSPQLGLTAVFGMRTGVTRAMKHQNKIFNSCGLRKSRAKLAFNHGGESCEGYLPHYFARFRNPQCK